MAPQDPGYTGGTDGEQVPFAPPYQEPEAVAGVVHDPGYTGGTDGEQVPFAPPYEEPDAVAAEAEATPAKKATKSSD